MSGKPDPRKASAADSKSQSRTLNSVIYPSLSKLLKLHPEEEAVAAVRRLPELDRGTVRRTFETRFSARRMAEDYLAVYRGLIEDRRPRLVAV